jgi:hypothetical protein
VVVGEPELGAGVAIATVDTWFRYLQVWGGTDRLLGVIRSRAPRSARFIACPCGRRPPLLIPGITTPRRACAVCGTPEGQLRKAGRSRMTGPWIVVGGHGVEVANVTARTVLESGGSSFSSPGAEHGIVRRAIASSRQALSSLPFACSVTEQPPSFRWDEWGLIVALAALCDRRVFNRALPNQSGGG